MEKGEEGKLKVTAEALKKLDLKDFGYFKIEYQEVLKKLETSLDKGLTSKQVEERLKEYGTNELSKEEDKSLWERVVESFEDTLVRILLIAAVISFIIALTGKSNISLTRIR